MLKTAHVLCLTLLVASPVISQDVEEESLSVSHDAHENEEPRLILEDPISWSASGEVLDENHAWYRRRRSLERNQHLSKEGEDLDAAESVVFMPAHMRLAKQVAVEECRQRSHQFRTWRRLRPNIRTPHRVHCNDHCCFPYMGFE